MKKVLPVLLGLLLALCASNCFALTGGGMTKGGEGGSGPAMMEKGGQAGKGIMSHEEMMDHMNVTMQHISGMMVHMSGMMKAMPSEKMKKMYKIMNEASVQMRDLSKMMRKGSASYKEVKVMQDRQKKMDKMMEEVSKQ